jgi:phospholipase C
MPAPSGPDPALQVSDEEALGRLREVEHVVVVMMENRSFDQMLGFLQGEGLDVDGLQGAKPNFDAAGNRYDSFEWGPGETVPPTPPGRKAKLLDPCHSPHCVQEQLRDANTGFVRNFAATRREDDQQVELAPEFLRVPMGHFGAQHLPTYRHLGHEFCVCDRWHSSIPGDTWPNRLYSIAGKEGESVTHRPGRLHDWLRRLGRLPGIGKIAKAPVYEEAAFTRQLQLPQWRWYSYDPATLRGIDKRYRDFRHPNRDNFAFFNRKRVDFAEQAAEALVVELHDSFLDDAAKGQLRDVSWIDPNFIDVKVFNPNSDDDHPPSDVHEGQAFILDLYEALVKSPQWRDTVLVVVYDEHGGFYDHVPPPPTQPGDPAKHRTLGLRVPALVVGPRVRRGVSHETFEHTSLIATILRRFTADPEAALAAMPWRVRRAPHLGGLLEAEPRAEALDRERLLAEIAAAREQLDGSRKTARERRRAEIGGPSGEIDGGAGQRQELLDWQEEFFGFALTMRDHGLPPGQP